MSNLDNNAALYIAKGLGRTVALFLGAGVALAVGVAGIGWWASSGTDRTDPTSTTTEFLTRYATHAPQVCELTTSKLRGEFTGDGRCTGQAGGQEPAVEIFSAKVCGDKALARAEVYPAGQVGTRYALVGLDLVDEQWSVRSVRPIQDRSVATATPGACDTSNSYGG